MREHTKVVHIGDKVIGGGNPILIQSMTNTKTEDVKATVNQILQLEKAGCDIIRSTANNEEAAKAFSAIKEQIHIPIVADIHFDYRLAILAMEHGADKIRINPGNIGGKERIKEVVDAAKRYHVPIRVGVNSGSLEKELVAKYNGVTAEGIVESALDKVRMLEEFDFDNMVISIKSSDVLMCVKAHELIAQQTNYPLHVGITEAGTLLRGNIKSAVGLGIILHQGIAEVLSLFVIYNIFIQCHTDSLCDSAFHLYTRKVRIYNCSAVYDCYIIDQFKYTCLFVDLNFCHTNHEWRWRYR